MPPTSPTFPAFENATAADYPAYARLFPELASGDDAPDLAHWLADYAPTTFIALAPPPLAGEAGRGVGEIVGYAYYQLLAGVGFVRNVVVAPDQRGKGYGRALMSELARRFRAGGADRWCLNVKPDNAAAIALYRAVGMTRAYDSVVLRMPWTVVDRLPLQPGIVGREVRPDEDEAFRAAFDLLPGQLAETRQHANRRVLGLFENGKPGQPKGLAALNLALGPDGMGSFPFRVARVELARNLLEAMRAHAQPRHVWAQAVIDDDEPLAEYLLRAGAVVRLHIEHHRGPLPSFPSSPSFAGGG